MNKIAVCFFGKLGHEHSTLISLLKYFGKDADYFISTNDATPTLIDELFAKYKLISYNIVDNPPKRFTSTFYRTNALNLKMKHEIKNNVSYDLVVLLQPNLILLTKDTMSLHIANVANEWIATSTKNSIYSVNRFFDVDGDLIIGTNKTMNIIASNMQYLHLWRGFNDLQSFMSTFNIVPIDEQQHKRILRCAYNQRIIASDGEEHRHVK